MKTNQINTWRKSSNHLREQWKNQLKKETYKERLQRKGLAELKKILRECLHEYIRIRDCDKPCVSCGEYKKLQAGHYYPAGKVESLRFETDNIHGQCLPCNYHEHGNLSFYRIELERRIGKERLEKLDARAVQYRRDGFYKWNKFELIDLIIKYKYEKI